MYNFFSTHLRSRLVVLLVVTIFLPVMNASVQARNLIGVPSTGTTSNAGGTASSAAASAANSQAATAATTAAAQAAQAAIISRRAQDSLVRSTAAFQNLQQAQAAAHAAALNNPLNVITGTDGTTTDGLGAGLLNPVGGVPTTTASSAIQIVDLAKSGKNQLVLGNGGSVTLPSGTSGTDQVTLSGAGSVTTSSGTVLASAGSLSTTTGGTLAATNGGIISLTAGSGTLNTTTSATITSSVAGTFTLPSGGATMTLSANQATTIPAGSTVNLAGSGTATVTVSGAGTLNLTGAGTLALSNATVGAGGTISAGSGTTSFTNGAVTSQAPGSTINLTGSGSINFVGSGNDVLPVIVQPTAAQTTPAFTTTGTVLSTTGYNLPSTWTGVGALSQTVDGNITTVTITQNQPQALLNWLTFNIGKNTLLDFDQSAGGASVGNYVAFNRILDPSLAPSQILGAIEAPGQVYVINQNGIIFNGSSQINTHALVASTLPINSNLVANGLLNNPSGQFLFTSVAIPSSNGSTSYDPNTDSNTLHNVTSGAITVEEGAHISTPGSPEGIGGKIALIAPTVDNEGELSSPDGQIILAAGQQVGFAAHPGADPSLRGLDVAIGQANGNESVTNGVNGYIDAPEADVTMTAPTVNQNGVINSSTSVSLNGRIDLLAVSGLAPDLLNGNLFDSLQGGTAVGGTVNLGPNSLTEILPDYSSTDTQVGSSLALPSEIYVAGGNFHMGNSSQLVAPNATATFSVGILNTPIASNTSQTNATTAPLPENTGVAPFSPTPNVGPVYLSTPGSVTLDPLANLDVSGSSNVQASAAENIVSAQLTEAVLENSPLQKDGPLRGQTVQVDITLTGTNPDGSTWYGSPIGDLSGYANLVPHTVGELTVAGGSVAINTNGSVSMSSSSTVNVSGGSIDYQGAMVQTTKVIGPNGNVIDISQATPDQAYQGVDNGFTVTSSKWGVSQTYSSLLQSGSYFDAGYVTGGSGGSLTINAPSVVLDGSLAGNTSVGVRQQSTPPVASAFNFNIQSGTQGTNPPSVTVVIQPTADAESSDPNTIYLSSDLFGVDGFSNATINTGSGIIDPASTALTQGSSIDIASDAVISTTVGGSLNFTSANINVNGQIYVPAGSVNITALPKDTLDSQQSIPTTYLPSVGNVDVASGAVIATTGLTFDEISGIAPGTLPYDVNGGKITISGAATTLETGSAVDASAGIIRNATAKITNGKGGTVSLNGLYLGFEGNADGRLVLDGSLSAYGFGQGGTLSLTAPAVEVGNGSAQTFPGAAVPLVLAPDFFSQGGFSSFAVKGTAGVQIVDGTVIAPILTEEIANQSGQQFGLNLISSALLPQYPAAPINLSFSAPGQTGEFIATLSLGSDSSITTGATGTVSLTGQLVDILGSVTAPGGQITVSGASTGGLGGVQAGTFVPPKVSIHLGSDAVLSVTGEEITAPTHIGSQTFNAGQVVAGGTIAITGNIVGDTGASLQADGTVGQIDVPADSTGLSLQTSAFQRSTNPYLNETIGSSGGSISLNGIEELYYNGTISANAGNQTAIGGILTIGSGLATIYTAPSTNVGNPELFISQSGTFSPGTVTLGQPLSGVSQLGGGHFTVDQFNHGGFGSLILNGSVEFENGTASNPINIVASQKVEIIPDSLNGTIFADGSNEAINITAPYIEIGATSLNFNGQSVIADAPSYATITGTVSTTTINTTTNTTTTTTSTLNLPAPPLPGLASPTYGAAQLSLSATDLIDVGFLSLQNIGTTTFSVPTGDIRGGGLLYASGVINLQAGQIYTPTAATFTVAAFDSASQAGSINITGGVARPLPLSAGGTIDIYATDITQDGDLQAPFGVVNLGALPDSTTGLTPVLAGVDYILNDTTQIYQATPDYIQHAPVTQHLILGQDSITSVSGVSSTGQALDLPYGTILNGGQWIAPNGADITAGGLPAKAINLKGVNVTDSQGSLVDIAGGGDLFAYQFTPGVGGTSDILNIDKYANGAIVINSANQVVASNSFAIVPAYGLNYAPIDLTIDSNGNLPYANSSVTSQVGNEIYLAGGDGLPAGNYSILPARYALLPGAFLVTPTSSAPPTTTSLNPDGSTAMAGYLYNGLNSNRQIVPNVTAFEVDSSSVINARAQYDISSANIFLKASAITNNQPVPRLPVDAGQLVFSATASLDIQGGLSGQAGLGGLGSTVDIGSTDDIYIVSNTGGTPTLNVPTGMDPADYAFLTLSADQLDKFGADSLLIGGVRTALPSGTSIDPTTNAIYLENSSATPLTGNEVILVSNKMLTLNAGSSIQQSSVVSTESNLMIGSSTTPGSGDGTLIRVTGDPNAQFTRLGVNTTDAAVNLTIGAGASIGGVAITLDSSSGASIDPTAVFDQNVAGQALVLSSGAISLQVDPSVSLASAPGLVLGNSALQTLESSVGRLSLSSYSTINLYGAGALGELDDKGEPVVQNLSLQGAGIFGFDANGGTVTFNAQNVSINNSGNQVLPTSPPSTSSGSTLVINADTINFGANVFAADSYSNVQLTASNDVLVNGTGGFNAQGGLNLTTPMITATAGANFTFNAEGGSLSVTKPSVARTPSTTGGLGATISFTGASVFLGSEVFAPSGTINATATSEDVEVQSGGNLNVSGQSATFGNVTAYNNGGQINLTSDSGGVTIDTGGLVNVSAQTGGGNAGTLSISAANGALSVADGTLSATAGASGTGGTFNAELGQVATLSAITTPLTDGGFRSINLDVLNGSVTVDGAVGGAIGQNGLASFSLTAEQGGITVNGAINASGLTGGTIDLYSNQGVTVNAELSVAGQQFDSAGEGGLIDIETLGAGSPGGNSIVIGSNAMLDLTVAGGVGGLLHLRAPQTENGTDLAVDPIAGKILGASSVVLEGYQIYTPTNGTIDATLEGSVMNSVAGTIYGDAQTFAGNTSAILTRVLGLSGAPTADQMTLYQVTPGAEITNPTGDLTLASDWDLSSFRFGPNNVAGDLTIRAAGNLVFTGSLTDGFAYNSNDTENVATSAYTWDVMSGPSWSYRLVAGALFSQSGTTTANYGSVQSLAALGLNTNSLTNASPQAGSLLLGKNIPVGISYGTTTATVAATYAQLIRTGGGSITIDAGGSVDLLNQLATIYTAGSLAPSIPGFDSPTGTSDSSFQTGVYKLNLAPAPQYTAQYTEGGGNILIDAQQDILHLTMDSSGNLVLDTSWQFPTNWLYRRGATNSTDVFATTKLLKPGGITEVATTTWWVDFSNFFEGIGALGGGNVSLQAGGNIMNVDAVVPTNARMPYADASGNPVPDVASNLVELGGGNLSVIAGGAIEGGTYYVERGTGTIEAKTITSADDAARISKEDISLGQSTPLPLTLFVGDSSFTVDATNDLTIGSTVNPFWLPQGIGNTFNDESIFNTYGASAAVNLSSLLGTITIQGSEFSGNSLPSHSSQLPGGLYDAYLSNASPGGLRSTTFRSEQSLNGTPWTLTLDPTSVGSNFIDNVGNYSTFYALSPPIFGATAFSGDIQYNSDQILAPSAQGTLRLLAAGTVDGAFNFSTIGDGLTASITILDDDPSQLPSVVNPFGLGSSTVDPRNNPSIGASITRALALLDETSGYQGQSLSTLESYHTSGLLHDDPTAPPVEIDTISGDIGDLTLISPEKVNISSGLDLQDVSLYIQNNNLDDISIVTANRDITLYDPNSARLVDLDAADSFYVAFGDLQISGPGTLEVLAGRNLDLGEGVPPNSANVLGVGLGITSIGQSRDPYLPFGGADIIAAAGLGDTSGLSSNSSSNLQLVNFQAFQDAFLNDPAGIESARYLPDLETLLGLTGVSNSQIWDIFSGTTDTSLTTSELQIQSSLTPESRDALAATIFYDVLRDAGRDHNNPASPNVGTYNEGSAAIATLFPASGSYQGEISLTSREIKTTNEGDIDLLAPGGGIDVGLNNLGTQAVDQGILTVDGGNISIFTNNDVSIGTSRIFTLHGGNIIIWSTVGNIDAGASSRTVQSAPPTRVLVDSQSADVQTDLAGLATGGGIGVLETVVGAPPGNVDLIAPVGTVDAGDAGIRSSGNINVAAAQVLNAGNIQAGGSSSGVPTASTPNISSSVAAANAGGASQNAANAAATQHQPDQSEQQDLPSIISVEVIGYGGDDSASTETPADRNSPSATYVADRP